MSSFIPSTTILRPRAPRANRCARMQAEDGASTPPSPLDASSATAETPDTKPTASQGAACEGCGREGGPATGCNGDGRIIGGLGAVVGWWPIKAYRPCPDYLKKNKRYTRAGQSLEEIAFGRKGSGDDLSIGERLQGK